MKTTWILPVALLAALFSSAPRAAPSADREEFIDAARAAWSYGEKYFRPSTGLVAPLPTYDYATVWDLASSLAVLYTARELGFLPEDDYRLRMRTALVTIGKLALFDNAGFNKAYQVSTGAMVDRRQRGSPRGFGWSVTDIGRLLIWLKIVAARDPEFAATAEAAVRRLNFSRLVKDGYMWGEELGPAGARLQYQEGHLGYEQYAAQGFALWGHAPERALSLAENQLPVQVMGQTVAADARQRDRLTSEPFVLAGLELGWSPEMRRLASAVLATQEERAKRTGVMTIVSEDALSEPPHFFYYYCILANGRQFSIDVQDPKAVVENPRWISTKATYGWHALLPSAYTRAAVDAVQPSRTPNGWASGVYERTRKSTGTLNVNTTAVVMTAAVYAVRGQPMLARSRSGR